MVESVGDLVPHHLATHFARDLLLCTGEPNLSVVVELILIVSKVRGDCGVRVRYPLLAGLSATKRLLLQLLLFVLLRLLLISQ